MSLVFVPTSRRINCFTLLRKKKLLSKRSPSYIQDAMPRMIYMQLNEMCDFTLLLNCSFCTKKPVLKNNNLREVVGNFKVKT